MPIFCGTNAWSKRGLLDLNYPIHHGLVTHWENDEEIWKDTFIYHVMAADANSESSSYGVLLTEPPLNPIRGGL